MNNQSSRTHNGPMSPPETTDQRHPPHREGPTMTDNPPTMTAPPRPLIIVRRPTDEYLALTSGLTKELLRVRVPYTYEQLQYAQDFATIPREIWPEAFQQLCVPPTGTYEMYTQPSYQLPTPPSGATARIDQQSAAFTRPSGTKRPLKIDCRPVEFQVPSKSTTSNQQAHTYEMWRSYHYSLAQYHRDRLQWLSARASWQ
jgi:hypothetical protein